MRTLLFPALALALFAGIALGAGLAISYFAPLLDCYTATRACPHGIHLFR